ncbi:MAG: DUF418 domain-containing protein [Bacteroidota bacterium]
MPQPSQPTTAANRIVSLDILRGFALLGILIMNITSFSMPEAHYLNPMAEGPLIGADKWAFYFSQLLANQKFMSLFSILFGAGIVLMTHKIEQRGESAANRHFTRNFWLLMIGLLHAHLIWYGDILVPYALCSIWVFFFRKKDAKTLFIWATVFLSILLVLSLLIGWSISFMPEEDLTELCLTWQPTAEAIQAEKAAYLGTWSDHFPIRSKAAFELETFIFVFGASWQITGLMLMGMGLFKAGVLTAERTKAFYKKLLGIGLLIGLTFSIIGILQNEANNWSCEYSFLIGSQWTYLGSVPTALAYIGGMMLLCKSQWLIVLEKWLAPYGQMALTNYLMQSILATFLFYGHGLGRFGSIGRAEQWLYIIGIWVVQLLWSRWWMARFKFGPFEWLWRSLTYQKWQAIR